MAADENKKEYLTYSTGFRKNATLLIVKMIKMAADTQEGTSELMDEILHSIFFLGKINRPEYSPKELLDDGDEKLFESLREVFPEPFRLYSSRLPRRSPFSCVLDMVVHQTGQENEDEILKIMQDVVRELSRNADKSFYSNTICVSHGNDAVKVFHLKGQKNEDEIKTTLQELKYQLEKNATNETSYSTICISHGNSTHSVLNVKGQKNEDEMKTILQDLKNLLTKNADKLMLDSTISISHGNNTQSVFHLKGQINEDEIKTTLQELKHQLEKNATNETSYSTICVSHGSNSTHSVFRLKGQEIKDKDRIETILQKLECQLRKNTYSTITVYSGNSKHSMRHYGVSMSTTGSSAGKIMVAASCLKYWEQDVADAVMSYYPEKTVKTYFDLTIKLPDWVRCQAFELRSGKVKIPCRSCSNMFGLDTTDTQGWVYGNCAEAESLSNLLRKEKVGVQRIINRAVNRKKAANDVSKTLTKELENVKFIWDNKFYTAQRTIAENDGEEEPLLE